MSEREETEPPGAAAPSDVDTLVEPAPSSPVDDESTAPAESEGSLKLQETPERAERRVAATGLRLGTRVALTLLVASLVPTALAASTVLVLTPVDPATPPKPPEVSLAELRAANAELEAATTLLAQTTVDDATRRERALEQSLRDAARALARRAEEVRAAREEGDDAPLTLTELTPSLASLGVTDDGARRITSADGATLIAPPGAALPAMAPPPASPATVSWGPEEGGRKLGRVCVEAAGLCLVDELLLPPPPGALEHARRVVKKASAMLAPSEKGPALEVPDLEVLRRRLALAALALALLSSLWLAWRLRRDIVHGLQRAEARLSLLAAGQTSERDSDKRPRELVELDDAVDAVAAALGAARERDDADRRRATRLFALGEAVDLVSRGQLATRLPSSDDVAEATLAAAVNRMIDAFEQNVLRLKSHCGALLGDRPQAGFADDNEQDPAALIAKRVHGLKPIPPLLNDIGARLTALAKLPVGEQRVPGDLLRLAEAIAQRARAAQALLDSLESLVTALPHGEAAPRAATLSADERKALALLVKDLEALSVDGSLPRLVESLPELSAQDVASRLARAPTSA